MFASGCDPWYTENQFTGPPWWFLSLPRAPSRPLSGQERRSSPSPTAKSSRGSVSRRRVQRNVIGGRHPEAIGNCANINNNRATACVQQSELLRPRMTLTAGLFGWRGEQPRRLPVHCALTGRTSPGTPGQDSCPQLCGVLCHWVAGNGDWPESVLQRRSPRTGRSRMSRRRLARSSAISSTGRCQAPPATRMPHAC